MMPDINVCKRCLLQEMNEQAQYQNIFDLIAQLDPELKPDPIVYAQRLSSCQSCEMLYQGICRLCGCFVELRAAKRINKCPAVPMNWDKC